MNPASPVPLWEKAVGTDRDIGLAGGGPLDERPEEGLGAIQVDGRTHPVAQPGARRHRAAAQHQRVVQVLLERAQMDGVLVLGRHDQAEHVDVEPAGCGQIGDDQLREGAPKDVRSPGRPPR